METVLQYLSEIDISLFYWINLGWINPVFDWLMPFITKKEHWFPLWLVVIVLMLWKGGGEGRIAVLLIIPLIFLSDQLAASVFKPYFARLRPCVALENVHLLVKKKTSFSMPSAHATNFFALAAFFSHYYRKYRWYFYATAAMVALSRVYVGVHYPGDITAGALLGIFCAAVVLHGYRMLQIYWISLRPTYNETERD